LLFRKNRLKNKPSIIPDIIGIIQSAGPANRPSANKIMKNQKAVIIHQENCQQVMRAAGSRQLLPVCVCYAAIKIINSLESINTHPWGVYRKKTANAICCFLHNQWLVTIDYAGTFLCRISSRHL